MSRGGKTWKQVQAFWFKVHTRKDARFQLITPYLDSQRELLCACIKAGLDYDSVLHDIIKEEWYLVRTTGVRAEFVQLTWED